MLYNVIQISCSLTRLTIFLGEYYAIYIQFVIVTKSFIKY